ncbi:MAG: SCO family protein [Bauldia sp.]|nr:MAG: SCO family protein [Bauldia sp.]MBZ0230510.1 SCO family protein [Bauldia sp.]
MTGMKAIRYAAWGAVVLVAIAVGLTVYWRQTETLPGVITASIGGPFTLTDQTGATVTEASLKGHPSAMFFGYTFCPDVCPTTLYEATTWLEELGPDADTLKVYFITVDPERDTSKAMAEYLSAFDPRITGLTGTRPEIDKMLKAYRVYSRKVARDDGPYLMDHSASVYLLDKNGTFTGVVDYQEKHETAMAKLKKLVKGS